MKYLEGDLITLAEAGSFDVIVHGCNCFCRMRSGIAKTISERYPQVVEADDRTIKGDPYKLGTIVPVDIGKFTIINAYTQFRYGTDKKNVDYEAVTRCFEQIKKEFGWKMARPPVRFGIPQIGCGLAGGDWRTVSAIIDGVMGPDEDLTCVIYKV